MMKEFMSASVFTACLAAFATTIPAHAQLNGADSGGANLISEFKVTDAAGLRPYRAAVEASFKVFGGRFVVPGGKVDPLEGTPIDRVIMIEFPSRNLAQAWYDSDAYGAIRSVRQRSADARVYIMEALPK